MTDINPLRDRLRDAWEKPAQAPMNAAEVDQAQIVATRILRTLKQAREGAFTSIENEAIEIVALAILLRERPGQKWTPIAFIVAIVGVVIAALYFMRYS